MPRKPSSIPENVRKYRPDICTEIKEISGHYYVYSYHSIKLPSGNWGKKTDKCIGKIVPDKGFIPNKNYVSKEHPELLTDEAKLIMKTAAEEDNAEIITVDADTITGELKI